MNGIGSLDKEVIQKIEMPPAYHPGLKKLIRDKAASLDEIRWKMFAHIVSPNLDFKRLKSASEEGFLYPVCQLRVLQHDMEEPILFGWEVQLILLQHLKYRNMNDDEKQV